LSAATFRVIGFGVALPLLLLACREPALERPDVVLITLDTTRADHLGVYGYERNTSPNLDRFAGDAIVYTRAWSTASWTLPAHASMFTGKLPTAHGAHYAAKTGNAALGDAMSDALWREFNSRASGPRVNVLGEDQQTLAELLAVRGYATGVFAGGPWLSPEFGLLQGYAHRDAKIDSMSGEPADALSDRAIAWIESVPRDRPLHLVVNYFDPHSPYAPPPGYDDLPAAKREIEVSIDAGIGGRPLPPAQREAYIDRYDGEIRFMDHHFGRLLDALRAAGRYDGAFIAVASDHGELFGEHRLMAHGRSLFEEVLRVPLLVRRPHGRAAGTRSDDPASLVDLLPSIAEVVALELPEDIQGVALGQRALVVAEIFPDAHSIRLYGKRFDRTLQAAIRWPWKLVRSDSGTNGLFRLDDDPAELRDRAGAPEQAALETALDDALDGVHPPATLEAPGAVPDETRERLRALGYGD
jgi:arylsulfatase A-like enzyme